MNDRADFPGTDAGASDRSPSLVAFGERLRRLRARRGLPRRALAEAADVSERHLANLEYGVGNPSLLVLEQVARSLQCPMAELVGDVTASSAEWLLIRELLEGRPEPELQRARLAIGEALGMGGDARQRGRRIALAGLRGAGKSTLGRRLAADLEVPFLELSREIEAVAGCPVHEIHDLYGPTAYRRYERRALEQALQIHPEFVLATPGGLVSEAATFNLLLGHCTTVWLRADPQDHMERVVRQGDLRPMAAGGEAMEDLRRILAGRAEFYAKAELQLDTSRQSEDESFQKLRRLVRVHLQLGA